ncbi:tetratricopeptide repeat protein [Sphingomonas rosea]|uniref:Tetratricopeptide repeat protein n=1 Tax=Sphingomonas rosea TaxID=335605 RepID=A0ABP7TZ51_9SPHN
MALAPGETSETFIREVDENLRRDQAEAVVKRYGKVFIGAAIVLLLAVAGWLFWKDRQATQAAENSEAFAAILQDIGGPKSSGSAGRLDALAENTNGSMEGAVRLTRAALALQDSDRKTAIAQYKAVAEDKSVPQAYRDAATVRQTQLEYDSLKPDEVIARLQPLAVKDNAWFGSAGEMTALAMLKANRRPEAVALLNAIAAEQTVPPTLRARAEQLAAGLNIPAAPAAR